MWRTICAGLRKKAKGKKCECDDVLRNAKKYIENFLKIRTKDGKIVPFVLNEPQNRFYEAIKKRWNAGKPVRMIVLKARQMGFSTLTEGLIFWATATKQNTEAMIVAHKDEATSNIFRMSKLFYDRLPEQIRPQRQASNAQELSFDKPSGSKSEVEGLRSRIRCATAGGSGVGRSYTLQCVHMSEFAFWPGDKMATYTGLMQTVPDEAHTLVVIESTANGYDEFKDLWDAAVKAHRDGDEDGFIPIFFPWYEMHAYRRAVPPDFVPTQEEIELQAQFDLDLEQLAWRRWCIKVNCGGDINMFHQEYPATPEEAFISTGQSVFEKTQLVKRIEEVRNVQWIRGSFRYDYDDALPRGQKIKNIRFVESNDGIIKIQKQPEKGVPYVIGGDTAGTGSDKFTAQILDNTTGAQIAVMSHQFDETMYTRQVYCLGRYYNDALVGIEVNYSTYCVKELERLGYPRQFLRHREDNFLQSITTQLGFRTDQITRPLIIDGLKEIVKEHIELIGDIDTLEEMLRFVYNDSYRPEAAARAHDDLVIALAIAHYIRPQQSMRKELPEAEKKRWTQDMWDDYNNASDAERALMIKMWGVPM